MIPEIELLLNDFDQADTYIAIDKLTIDAVTGKHDWQRKIRDQLLLNLNRNLSRYRLLTPGKGLPAETVSRKLDELILFYFENGYLPWWNKALIKDDFEMVLHQWISSERSPAGAAAIEVRLQQILSVPVLERIIYQVPHEQFFQFLQNIFTRETVLLKQAASFFKELNKTGITRSTQLAITKPVYGFILTNLLKNRGRLDVEPVMQFFYAGLKQHKQAAAILKKKFSVNEKNEVHGKISDTNAVLNPVFSAWKQLVMQEKAHDKGRNNPGPENKAVKPKKPDIQKQSRFDDTLKGSVASMIIKGNDAKTGQEGIFIENAGAVIIAAFLPVLFGKLKIVKQGILVNPGRAALIIQHIVSGKTKASEFELVLPKILSGLDPEMPVDTSRNITAVQKKEVNEMLASVIEHWAVIKNTSVSGLRDSFLKRSGKLSLVNNEWLLQVEQKPFDMLLQQLPWSISMIKLPWMKNLLKTEWV